ncbi:hypothetical protein FW774_11005 [Pedobacter sp. BS3]|uniref:hypothetical protein n=1 Tax=Pedobacter sp. BS3 TaxID=2567937 RepID=UPI0011ED58D2|nr:hypothetical protein [Pedobacter sp. BS3]TZF83969.1 hypothetical protein FW774_11005 [Pedobacter sp. BS3]
MKSEIQIKEQIEKLKKAISKDEEFLRTATGNDVTLENRIAIQNEINLRKGQKSMLEWLFSKEPTERELSQFRMPS